MAHHIQFHFLNWNSHWKGQIKNDGQHLEINGVKIQQVDEGECYKYFGQDENISYVGTVNKERVSKEYFTRIVM